MVVRTWPECPRLDRWSFCKIEKALSFRDSPEDWLIWVYGGRIFAHPCQPIGLLNKKASLSKQSAVRVRGHFTMRGHTTDVHTHPLRSVRQSNLKFEVSFATPRKQNGARRSGCDRRRWRYVCLPKAGGKFNRASYDTRERRDRSKAIPVVSKISNGLYARMTSRHLSRDS